MKKSIVALLTIAMLTGTVSCGGTEESIDATDTETTVTEIVEAETNVYDTLPKADYEGYTFNAFQYVYDHLPDMTKYHLTVEETTGESVIDALYHAKLTVEEGLNVTLKTMVTGDWEHVDDTIMNIVMAGDTTYDVYFPLGTQLLLSGSAAKLNEIKGFTFENPWWSKSAMDSMSITGDYYEAYGNLSLSLYSFFEIMVYNEAMRVDYGIENLYDTVKNGKWTLDKLSEVAYAVATDTNGDGKWNHKDGDIYGLSTFTNLGVHAILKCADTNLIGFDENNTVYYIGPDERFVNAFEKFSAMVMDSNMYYSSKNTATLSNFELMAQDGLFIAVGHLLELEGLRSMETDYGILPLPKYDETQAEYITYMYNDCKPAIIPVINPGMERTAVILENLSAQTYRLAKDTYIDDMLNQKLVRNQESVEMIQFISNESQIKTDLVFTYNWGGLVSRMCAMVERSPSTLMSTLASMQDSIESDIQSYVDALRTSGN